MIRKTGIVLALATSGLLAVSPLAFAGGGDYDGHHKKSSHSKCKDSCKDDRDDDDRDDHKDRRKHDRDDDRKDHNKDRRNDKPARHDGGGDCNGSTTQVNSGRNGGGLINVSDLNVAVPVNVCDNDILGGVLGILSKDLHNNDR